MCARFNCKVHDSWYEECHLPKLAMGYRYGQGFDTRSDELRRQGAEVVEGDLLNPAMVQSALEGVKRACFTYPMADGPLEAATIFAAAARDSGLELVSTIHSYRAPRMIRHFAISNTSVITQNRP